MLKEGKIIELQLLNNGEKPARENQNEKERPTASF
jgi:hypothetical protein